MQLLTVTASVSSCASTPVPPARLLGLSNAPPPRLLRLRARPSVLIAPRAHGCPHGHRHGHCHDHRGGVDDDNDAHGSGVRGAAIMQAARAVGLAGVADALREHLHVWCVVALGLLLVAAACPHVALFGSGASRLVQSALIALACALVGG